KAGIHSSAIAQSDRWVRRDLILNREGGSGRHRRCRLRSQEEIVLPKGRNDLRIVIRRRYSVLLPDLLDRAAEQRLPIGAPQPFGAPAAAIAFKDRAPDRLPGPRLRNPPCREQGDDREAELPGLRVRERHEGGFAERVASIA